MCFVFFKNHILKVLARGVCSLANYSVAYEETQSNRLSDFRDFVCSLFFTFILGLLARASLMNSYKTFFTAHKK